MSLPIPKSALRLAKPFALLIGLCLAWPSAPAAGPEDAPLAKRAMHLLRDHCVSCHNPKKTKGDLDLTQRQTALSGGGEGPAFVEGKPGDSRLIQFLKPDSDPHMPPKKQLSDEHIATLTRWVANGAAWLPDELAVKNQPIAATELGSLPEGYRPVFALALSPDDTKLAAGHGNQVLVHSVTEKTPSRLAKLDGHRDVIQSIAWSPDGKHLATGGFRKVILWNTNDWKPTGQVTALPGRVTAIAFSADGQALITASNAPGQAGEIALWETSTLAKRLGWPAHSGTVFALTLAPSGTTLATAGEDQLIRFWNLTDGKQLKQIEAHSAPVLSLAYKPDGTAIASGGADKELKIWDTKTREQKMLVTGHPGNVAAIVWPQKNAELITASDDGSLRLCTEAGKRPSKTWGAAADLLHSLDATKDGTRFFGGAENGNVYAWDKKGKITQTLGWQK